MTGELFVWRMLVSQLNLNNVGRGHYRNKYEMWFVCCWCWWSGSKSNLCDLYMEWIFEFWKCCFSYSLERTGMNRSKCTTVSSFFKLSIVNTCVEQLSVQGQSNVGRGMRKEWWMRNEKWEMRNEEWGVSCYLRLKYKIWKINYYIYLFVIFVSWGVLMKQRYNRYVLSLLN